MLSQNKLLSKLPLSTQVCANTKVASSHVSNEKFSAKLAGLHIPRPKMPNFQQTFRKSVLSQVLFAFCRQNASVFCRAASPTVQRLSGSRSTNDTSFICILSAKPHSRLVIEKTQVVAISHFLRQRQKFSNVQQAGQRR